MPMYNPPSKLSASALAALFGTDGNVVGTQSADKVRLDLNWDFVVTNPTDIADVDGAVLTKKSAVIAAILQRLATLEGGGGGGTGTVPANTAAPSISGTGTVGSVLTANKGTWSGTPAPTYAYVWKRNGTAISGATASTYTTVSADGGTAVTVTVTATNASGSATATSPSVAIVSPGGGVTDLYPAYDGAFDPVNSFYKIGAFKTNSLSEFLARPEVSFNSNPSAQIDSTGYLPLADGGNRGPNLAILNSPGTDWSIYAEEKVGSTLDSNYSYLFALVKASDVSKRVEVISDGQTQTQMRGSFGGNGNDNNFGSQGTPNSVMRFSMTTSGTSTKFFAAGALGYSSPNTEMTSNPKGLIVVGDGPNEDVRHWKSRILKLLWKASTDTDSAAAAWTA